MQQPKKKIYTLLEIINSRDSSFNKIISHFENSDLNNYIELLREIINKFELKQGDDRLVFSIRHNRLNFIIGQRYCWNIFVSDSRGKFGVISKDKIIEDSTPYDGPTPQPYYTHFNDFSITKTNFNSILFSIGEELKRAIKSGYRKHNNIDFENYVFGNISTRADINKMELSLNAILFGPPGTGKTYNSINKAVEIVTGIKSNHADSKVIFDKLKKEGQIEFVTFHQNYSYKDFMVGIRPNIEFEHLRFKPYKGIFYEIAKKARENYLASKEQTALAKSFDQVFNEIIKPIEEKNESVEITIVSGLKYKITDVSDTTIHCKNHQVVRNTHLVFKHSKM